MSPNCANLDVSLQTAPAAAVERGRTRQIARIGNNLNQIARWANTYASEPRSARSSPTGSVPFGLLR